MKHIIYIFLTLLIFSVFPEIAHADSSSNTTIINNVSSSTNQTSTSNCHTTVTMDTNGQVQHSDSTNCGDVNMQSTNGSSSVHITNNSTGNSSASQSNTDLTQTSIITPTMLSPTVTPMFRHAMQQIKPAHQNRKEASLNIFQKLHTWFVNLLTTLRF